MKLHDVSYYLYNAVNSGIISDNQSLRLFQLICDHEYDYFQEWEKENLNYVYRSYIGRTSSFYYDSKWSGDQIENDIIEELLEGKGVLKDCFGNLDHRLHDYLFKNTDIMAEFIESDEDEFIDFLETETEILTSIEDDLNYVEKIVTEAKKAYEYLSDFKKQENEYSLAKHYLENEIAEYYSVDIAEKLFCKILSHIEYLNEVKKLVVINQTINNEYSIKVNINETEFNINTGIKSTHELSEHCITCTMYSLNALIKNNFKL